MRCVLRWQIPNLGGPARSRARLWRARRSGRASGDDRRRIAWQDAPILIASVVGTESTRKVRSAQVRQLEQADILVAPSNAQACELAVAIANNAGR